MTCCQIIIKTIADKYGINVAGVEKLIPNLDDKANYVFTTEISSYICHS